MTTPTPTVLEVVVTSKLTGMTEAAFNVPAARTAFTNGVVKVIGGGVTAEDVTITDVVPFTGRRLLASGVDVVWKVSGLKDATQASAVCAPLPSACVCGLSSSFLASAMGREGEEAVEWGGRSSRQSLKCLHWQRKICACMLTVTKRLHSVTRLFHDASLGSPL